MENATKAIIIAGGVLIAIITISVFYFVFGQVSFMAGETNQDDKQKELIAFNKSFEAYNKRLMYGADIISVLNKAIDNNRKYGVENYLQPEQPEFLDFYVDVVFTVYTGKQDGTSPATKTYTLSENYGKGTDNTIESNYLDKKSIKKGENSIHEFKVAGFRCENIEYTTKDSVKNKSLVGNVGRVSKLTFVQRQN